MFYLCIEGGLLGKYTQKCKIELENYTEISLIIPTNGKKYSNIKLPNHSKYNDLFLYNI